MAKSKSAQANTAAKLSKNEVQSLSSVKAGAVTKPSQTSKAKSKETAKQAVKAQEARKNSKKVREPSPEVEIDESEDDDEEDDEEDDEDSASSASSDEESEEEPPKTNGVKTDGIRTNSVSKAEPKGEAETSDSSESSDASDSDSDEEDDSEDDEEVAKTPKAADDDSEDESEDDSDDDSEEDKEKSKGAVEPKAFDGKLAKVSSKNEDSEEDDEDDDSEGSEEDSDDSDKSDNSEEEEKPATKNNKRKAETEAAPVSKKSKNAEIDDLSDAAKKNLFVGHLSYNIDEEWLQREFEPFGELTRVIHMIDRETQRPRGFGYVEFVNAEDGVKAQEAMNGKEIDGRAINVDFSRPKAEQQPRQDRSKQYGDRVRSPPSSTIFVANLAFAATSEAVGEEFGKHAEVVGVRLPTDRDSGEPKGFGYVEFSSIEEAQKAFAGMEGQAIMGRVPRLDYSTPRPDRNGDSSGGRGGFSRGGGRGGFDRGGRGGGRGRGGFDHGGRGGGRGGRGGSTNRGGFGDFQGKKMSFS